MPEQQPNQPSNDEQKKLPHPVFDWRPLLFTTVLFISYYMATLGGATGPEAIAYSAFKELVAHGQVSSITLKGKEIRGARIGATSQKDARHFTSMLPDIDDPTLIPLLEQHHVEIVAKSTESPLWLTIIISIVPWILIFALFAYSNRALQSRMGGSGGGMFGFSKSKAKLYEKMDVGITFDEVAGLESAKIDLREVIEYLIQPEKFRKLGASLPRGILMMGPPGTGKTLLAKATAAEAGVPFFSVSGSEFIEMFVGVGASRVRDMFSEAREKSPSLIFIDEIDSVGRVRGTGMGGGNDEREQTLNQILAEMDGFSTDDAVVVLAATNRPDVLDPALMRPGRFDRKVTLELPQKRARLKILEVHSRKKPIANDVDLEHYAARTIGYSGADLENFVNEAALHAARFDKHEIDHEDFEYAHDKIMLGSVGQEIVNSDDKKRIAYHEAGHAITALLSPNSDPVTKITIVPRGRSLGMTETLPSEDRVNYLQDFLEERLRILLGGRCAEKLALGQVSTGAADDLKQCTLLARRMVTQWGMNEKLGPVNFPQHEEHPFLGMEMAQPKDFSDHTARLIDEEVQRLVNRSEKETSQLLSDNRTLLDILANALLEQETLEHDEIKKVLGDNYPIT